MLENRVCKRPNLPQGERRLLRQQTDAAFRNAATQSESAANAINIPSNSKRNGLRLGDADNMITAVVGAFLLPSPSHFYPYREKESQTSPFSERAKVWLKSL